MPVLRVVLPEGEKMLEVPVGANLRQSLLAAGITPYTWVTRQMNCGGRGLCATCGVWTEGEAPPEHWHDRLADHFGYPRLSCQIRVNEDMTVRLVEKLIWGAPDPLRARRRRAEP
jgi:ferredoxin